MSSSLFLSIFLVACAFCTRIENDEPIEKKFADSEKIDHDMTKQSCIGDCLLLYERIVNRVNKSTNPCENKFSHVCRGKEYDKIKKDTKDTFLRIQTFVANTLRSKINNDESKSLNLERRFYQDCMRLGDKYRQGQEDLAFETLYREIKSFLKYNDDWQDLDHKLESMGFGHSFFNIKVIRDPEEPAQNIIMLQPPSISHLRNIIYRIHNVISHMSFSNERNWESINRLRDLYHPIRNNLEGPIQEFFKNLLLIRTIQLQKYSEKLQNARITVQDLHSFYTQLSEFADFAQIEWAKVIWQTFQKVRIKIKDTENIIVLNRPYFIELAKLLRDTPNNVIISAMWTRILTENLVYIDWNLSALLEGIDKSTFCLEETKLYGASHRLMYESINANENSVWLLKETEEMLSNIENVFLAEMLESPMLTASQREEMRYKLKSITNNLFDHVFDPVPNFYDHFYLTPSYFFNIIQYRKMIRNQELRTLRDSLYLMPFNVFDLDDLRNRFIFNIFQYSEGLLSPRMPKAVYYGDYGVKIAGILYALIHENRFRNGIRDRKSNDWLAHPEYSDESISCFSSIEMPEYTRDQVLDLITEIIGLQTAYKAMLEDSTAEFYDRSIYIMLLNNKINRNRLFFLTYIKSRCQTDEQMMHAALLYSQAIFEAFECKKMQVETKQRCFLKPFDQPNEDILSVKVCNASSALYTK